MTEHSEEKTITRENLESLYDMIRDQPAPRELPVIEYEDKHWYVDGRLHEIRNVHDIDDRISFDKFPSERERLEPRERIE